MTVIILIALLSLGLGFVVGFTIEVKPKVCKKTVKLKKENAEIQKEYQNFLNYDGSIQE